jgi:hypothetical protein
MLRALCTWQRWIGAFSPKVRRIAHYNAQWLIEKNGHLSPHARRRQHELAAMPMAA